MVLEVIMAIGMIFKKGGDEADLAVKIIKDMVEIYETRDFEGAITKELKDRGVV